MKWKRNNYIGLILFLFAMFLSDASWLSPLVGVIGIVLMFNISFVNKEGN